MKAGIITPSKYGYNLGDRVRCCESGGTTDTNMTQERHMREGEEGIIVGLHGTYTQVLIDNGAYCVRREDYSEERLTIIKKAEAINNVYEIF